MRWSARMPRTTAEADEVWDMSCKQEPLLMLSPLTGHVYVVTKYERIEGGTFVAYEKFDVTEQFDKIAEQKAKEFLDG